MLGFRSSEFRVFGRRSSEFMGSGFSVFGV